MRNYYVKPGLRPTATENEPELQWLEDSINYLFSLSILIGRELFGLVFSFVRSIFCLFAKTKL